MWVQVPPGVPEKEYLVDLSEEEFDRVKSMNFNQIVENEPDIVEKAITGSGSVFEILVSLGVGPTNTSARNTLKIFAEMRKINLPVGRSKPSFSSLTEKEFREEYLIKDRYLGTTLRKYILIFEILEYSCNNNLCPLYGTVDPTWAGEELTLDLDHEDGNNKNNTLPNLRFLCPNCHSQTKTYKGRNIKREKSPLTEICPACKINEKRVASSTCVECYRKQPRKNSGYPPLSEILESISRVGVESTARKYGVSGNALKKFLARRGMKVSDYSPYAHKSQK